MLPIMGRDGVAVDARVAGLVARVVEGEVVNVSAACRELKISREQFYKYRRRFVAEGVVGFFPRSRRPGRFPTAVEPRVEDAIVAARKRLAEQGGDAGPISIGWWLADHPDQAWGGQPAPAVLPSRATIARVLTRRGQVVAAPAKRPRRPGRRFTRPAANDLWQIDGYQHVLANGDPVVVIEIFDDHSRLLLVSHVAASESAEAAWAAFSTAAARYGLPRQLLSDNGPAFSGARRGWTSRLDAAVRALGVQPITASAGHPQTCGKAERGHATGRRWLTEQPAATSIAELHALLDITYRAYYNNDRRHQGLDGLTPHQAWTLAPRSGPADHPLDQPLHVTTHPISHAGCIGLDGTEIGLGRAHANKTATAFRTGDHVTVFIDGAHTRTLTLDRTRRYQPRERLPSPPPNNDTVSANS
jgi:transposase InsO family protein